MKSLETAWRAVADTFEGARLAAEASARKNTVADLNQAARRLQNYSEASEWFDAVLDGARPFAQEVAVLSLEGETLHVKGTRGIALENGLSIPLAAANAFRSAKETGELVVTLAVPSEISAPLASTGAQRAYLVPIFNGARAVAFLFAPAREGTDPNALDPNALELIAAIASLALAKNAQQPVHVQIAPALPRVEIDNHAAAGERRHPAWDGLSDQHKLAHVRAQRMARTKVAEMCLYRPEACDNGRRERDVYLFLKKEIDNAREQFRAQFLSVPSMVDYLHLELRRQIAGNDESLLGADYPGPLV